MGAWGAVVEAGGTRSVRRTEWALRAWHSRSTIVAWRRTKLLTSNQDGREQETSSVTASSSWRARSRARCVGRKNCSGVMG